jgi:hypothetical protein
MDSPDAPRPLLTWLFRLDAREDRAKSPEFFAPASGESRLVVATRAPRQSAVQIELSVERQESCWIELWRSVEFRQGWSSHSLRCPFAGARLRLRARLSGGGWAEATARVFAAAAPKGDPRGPREEIA